MEGGATGGGARALHQTKKGKKKKEQKRAGDDVELFNLKNTLHDAWFDFIT